MKRVTLASTLATIAMVGLFVLIIGDNDCSFCYTANAYVVRFIIVGLVTIGITVFFARQYTQMEGIAFDIANQPLLETHEATENVSFAGEGTIVSDQVVESHFSKTPCVYYHTVLEEYVRHGKSGDWKEIKNIIDAVPFFLEDKSGRLRIDTSGVDHDNSKSAILQKTAVRRKQYFSEIDAEAILKKVKFKENRRLYRKSEYILRPNTPAFVYGYVEKGDAGLALCEHEYYPLVVSRKTRDAFIREFSKGANVVYLSHVLMFIGFLFIILPPAYWHVFPFGVHILAAYVGGVIILGSIVFTMYNRMVLLRNRLLNAWSNKEGELKRRHDLVTQLAASVEGYVRHEKDVQALMAALRSSAEAVAGVAEAYPELQASETFKQLMVNLKDTEERIAYSRSFYNSAVRSYNTLIQQFPFTILATLCKFHPYEFLSSAKTDINPSTVL